jgi:photosystem II stability/assembly factor-like uncharacterized protein
VHPDHHALWIDPGDSRHMLLGNDGGFYATYDRGQRWQFIDNLPISQFYDIAVDTRDPYWIYGGAQDNGSWAFPSATYSRGGMTNADVLNTGFGDGFQSAVDPLEPRFVYANSQNGRAFLADMVTREEHFIQPVAPTGQDPYRFNWNTAIHVSPNDPRAYYMGAQKLLRTTDRGQTWKEISPDLTRRVPRAQLSVGAGFSNRTLSANDGVSAYGNITTISESPKTRGTIYVGTDDGNVQLTTDGGAHWTDLTSRFALGEPRYVSKVLASRHDARVAYVAFDGHWDDDTRPYLFKTIDGGATWTSITADIPDWKPITTLEEDPRRADVLFAGTEFGLYWTFDGARHWTAASGNLPPVLIDRIIVNPKTNDLILATHGRGVILLEDIAPFEGGGSATAAGDVQLFPLRGAIEVQTYRDIPWPGGNAFVARNSPIGSYVSYSIRTEPTRPDTAHIDVLASDGSMVSHMIGPNAIGTHRVLWDLRYQLAYVPPPADSGFYGPPRAPYVPPGEYTVRLTVRNQTLTQRVDIRADPRGAGSRDTQRARAAINTRAGDISRTYADVAVALDSIDADLAALRVEVKSPQADSAAAQVTRQVASLRQRARGNSITSGIGRVFDLTAAIESSSLAPTDAQQRTMDAATREFTEIARAVNDIVVTVLPALRARFGQPSRPVPSTVRPPKLAP